ncbi:hypothetical protein DXG01_017046, partial [Tephrocybe rancida]
NDLPPLNIEFSRGSLMIKNATMVEVVGVALEGFGILDCVPEGGDEVEVEGGVP